MKPKTITTGMRVGVFCGRLRLALALVMAAPLVWAASPLGGATTQERLDRREGDRQLQNRLDAPRLHELMRDEYREPQARRVRPGRREREWNEDLVPRRQQFDDRLDKQRRVRATL